MSKPQQIINNTQTILNDEEIKHRLNHLDVTKILEQEINRFKVFLMAWHCGKRSDQDFVNLCSREPIWKDKELSEYWFRNKEHNEL